VSNWYWRRVAVLFAASVALVSVRSLPETVKSWIRRRPSS
jgi:hypothetical protein